MIKNKKQFICQSCGAIYLKWIGKCENCNEWNTINEETTYKSNNQSIKLSQKQIEFENLNNANVKYTRLKTNLNEIDRVIGGGFVGGSVTLIGGDPGIGKSTLILQIVRNLSTQNEQCIYISGEESLSQVKIRANRLGIKKSPIQFASVIDASAISETISNLEKNCILVIDSIQTMYLPDIDSSPGSITQVKACAHELILAAKRTNSILIFIGHVTKDGSLAGPRVLEHMVDTVLYFEGDRNLQFRILRSVKNRFGPTNEIGIFEMLNEGLFEIKNPSELFLSDRQKNLPGSAIFAGLEGTRPILVEIQALVNPSTLPSPRRNVVGWDISRLAMLCAVLESRCKISLSNMDIFLNIAGGIKIVEPAADLAVAAAIISSVKKETISFSSVFFGEIGLSGEIRKVIQPELRIREAHKLGLTNIILPTKQKIIKDNKMNYYDMTLLSDLIDLIINKNRVS